MSVVHIGRGSSTGQRLDSAASNPDIELFVAVTYSPMPVAFWGFGPVVHFGLID
jgi:hypothetical protein